METSNTSKFVKFIFIVITLYSCNQHTDKAILLANSDDSISSRVMQPNKIDNVVDSINLVEKIETTIIDTIFKLRKVQELGAFIEKATKGERHLKIWIENKTVSANKSYYWVKVGEDNGSALVTHLNFHAYINPIKIMFYDILNDKEVSIDSLP